MPPDTIWSENSEYLQESAVYNTANAYDQAVAYNVSPSDNLPSVHSANGTLWTEKTE